MPDKVSPSQFAASVKAKYPEYKEYDDLELTNAMVKKYPEYKEYVDFGTPQKAEPAIPVIQPGAPVSKYQKAVQDDRSEIGKTLSTLYNNTIASLERFGGAIADLPAQFNIAAPGFTPTEIGKAQEQTKAFRQQPISKRLEPAKELKQKIGKAADIVRSGYTTREEEKAMAGQFNVMDGGIGLRDIQSLIASSGGMALDMGLGAMTGGTSFVLQGYNDAVEDYDAATQKAGIEQSEGARGLYGIAGGVINGLLEKFAVDKIVGDTPVFKDIQKKAIANVLRNTAGMTGKKAVDAIETAAVAEIKKLTSDLKRFGVRSAYRAGIEGGTEAVQSALEDGAKLAANLVQGNEAFNEDEIKKGFIQNIVNSGFAGGLMGPVFGAGADKAFGRNVNTQVLKDISEANTPEQLAAINDELAATFDENNFTQEERDAVMANANRYAQIKQTLPAGTNAIAQTIAIPLIENRIKLDNEIQTRRNSIETIDEAFRADEESAITLLEDKRAQINDDIREVVNNEKFDYYEDNGKFYKKLGENAPEEISKNRFDLQQLKTEGYATTTGQGPVQEGGTAGNIGQRQGTQEGGTQKTPTQADSRYRNISSEKAVGIPSFLGMMVTYKLPTRTITGTLVQEGQTLSVEDENGDVVAELGNIDELSNMSPEEMNLTVIEPNVELTENGFSVDGKELFNENENPFDAVSVDQNGTVMNVVLTTAGGKRRKFRGRVAQKIADQIDVRENQRITTADEKRQQEFAFPKPVAPKVITTKPTIAKVTEDNLNDIDKIPGSKLQKKVLGNVKNVVKAIGAAVKNITGSAVSVNIHDQKSFTDAVIEAGGTEQDSTSRGFYMADDGSIHLNMDAIASDTMLHEGFHPILDILAKYNPKIINELFTELESIPEAAGIIAQAKESYTGDVTQKKEAITDFVAGVADGRIVLNPSNFQKIKNFILNMLNKIGIGQGGLELMKVDNEQGLVKLAKFITEKFTTGETITFEGLETIVGDDTADPVTVSNIAVVNPIQFEYVKTNDKAYKRVDVKWVSKGLKLIVPKIKSSLYNIVSKSGGAIVVTNSDATGVGIRKGVLRQGGIGYTFIEQNVNDNIGFAASMDSKQGAFFKAVQEAARIRDEKFPEMKGKPVAVFVMVQAPEVMFGNAYGADYFIKSLSNALSNNEISIEDAKSDIINYFNSIKESNATGRKYANSIDALIELIQNGNLKSPKDKKKIYDLLITNRENKEDKSAKFGFDARRVLLGQFFNKVAPAKNKPGGRTRDILGKDGYNHESFYDIYGDENVIKSLEGDTKGRRMDDGGFTMTGFFVDPTITEEEYIRRSKAGTFQHKQFNGRFAGNDPFVLDGKYYVNEVFPEARFVDEFGNPVPVTTSTAGSMYPRTRSESQAIVERAKALSEPRFQSQKVPSEDIINGFYSPIKKRVNEFKLPNASAQKWKEIVGIKSDEAVFSGLTDWLNSKKPNEQISKNDVNKFMKNNRIEISERTRGGDYEVYKPSNGMTVKYFDNLDDAEAFVREAESEGDNYEINEPFGFLSTKYEKYQLPGGENYKEVLITQPQKNLNKPKDSAYNELIQKRDELVNQYDEEDKKTFSRDKNISDSAYKKMNRILDELDKINAELDQYIERVEPIKFKSSHYDEGNIITHLRMNTRTDADGKKVLFLEEVQSDWGQKGKSEGFLIPKEEKDKLEKEYEENKQRRVSIISEIQDAFNSEDYGKFKKLNEEEDKLNKRAEELTDAVYLKGYPRAPYVTNTNAWVKLGLKVALKEAVKQGASRIAWTTGEQQNQRYDLSKQVDEITYKNLGDGAYRIVTYKNGNATDRQDVPENRLEETLGKDVAERIINNVGDKNEYTGVNSLSGLNLSVGGKGMKAFYGDAKNPGIVANVAKALVKELTGKEGNISESNIKVLDEVPEGTTMADIYEAGGIIEFRKRLEIVSVQPAIDITPELKTSVKEGMPQFQKAPTKPITKGKLGGVKKTFKEQVRYGLLGKESVRLKEKMGGELSAELATAETRVQEAMKTIKKYGGAVTEKDISDFMEGKPSANQLPLDLATQLTEMRAQIDGLTERLIQLGVIDSQESIDYYRENKGKYLLRSYEAINFKENPLMANFQGKGLNIDNVAKKLKNVDRTIVNSALRYLSDRAKAKYIIQNALQQNTVKVVDFDKDNYSLVLTSNGQKIAKIPKDSGDTKNKAAVNFMSTYLIDPANIQSYNDIKNTIPNVQLSDDAALEEAKIDANSILDNSESYVMSKGLTGSTNVKSLRQRKDLSPEIRALMGEYTDPLYNYYATIFKISSLTSSRQYLNSLKEFGMGKFFFDKRTADATKMFAGEESEALKPLNGIYTFPEIYESLKVAEKQTASLLSQMAGRVRMLKTVYNPATHVKNIIGNMGFAVSNGHWENIPEAYKYMRAAITGKTDQDVMNMMDTLNRYGVLNNVIGIGELKAYFDKNESVDDFLKTVYNSANSSTTASKLGKAKANLSKIPKAIEKAYAIEDDVFKILAFVNESNRYSKAMFGVNYNKLSSDQKKEIDNIASEIVKDTYPTFSRVPKGVKTLSKVAFIGNFLAFPVESVRTQYNSLKLGMKEINSGNPKLKAVGYTRLGGALAYNSLFASLSMYAYNLAGAGITGAVGMLFGDDEEENTVSNAIKKFLAPWNKNSDVYVSKFKDGKLEYYDIGSLDSYGYQRRVWNAFWSTKNKGEFDKMMGSGIGELLDPWMAGDFVLDNFIKLRDNDNGRGGTIYNPEGKFIDRMKDQSLFVGKQFGPGALGSAIKIADAYQKGETDKVMDELGAQVFARRYSVDLNKQFQNYIYTEGTDPKKEVGFKARLENAKNLYNNSKRQNLSPIELSEKYGEALEAYKEILLTANEYYRAAALGGTNPKLLIESLKKSRIGRAEAMAIITGSFGKYDQAYIRK